MIYIKNIVFKLLFFITLFFIFNLEEIDSNSSKRSIYNLNNIYEEDYFTLYLKNINLFELNKITKKNDINIMSYIINDKKYYARNSEDLINKYTQDLSNEDKIYYTINGIKIDAITTRCQVYKIMELEKNNIIY